MNKPEPWLNVPRLGLVAAALATAVAGATARAAPAPRATAGAPGQPSRTKMGPPLDTPPITVTATKDAPSVESTFPAQGARIAPGLLVLRVTYDAHMRPDGWAYAEAGRPAAYPDCARAPRLLDDKRSFVLVCRTLPGKAYAVWFNRPPLVDFASMSRRPATPYELKFATTDEEPVRTLADAMKADPALSDQGEPVQAPGQARFGQDDTPPGY